MEVPRDKKIYFYIEPLFSSHGSLRANRKKRLGWPSVIVIAVVSILTGSPRSTAVVVAAHTDVQLGIVSEPSGSGGGGGDAMRGHLLLCTHARSRGQC